MVPKHRALQLLAMQHAHVCLQVLASAHLQGTVLCVLLEAWKDCPLQTQDKFLLALRVTISLYRSIDPALWCVTPVKTLTASHYTDEFIDRVIVHIMQSCVIDWCTAQPLNGNSLEQWH